MYWSILYGFVKITSVVKYNNTLIDIEFRKAKANFRAMESVQTDDYKIWTLVTAFTRSTEGKYINLHYFIEQVMSELKETSCSFLLHFDWLLQNAGSVFTMIFIMLLFFFNKPKYFTPSVSRCVIF